MALPSVGPGSALILQDGVPQPVTPIPPAKEGPLNEDGSETRRAPAGIAAALFVAFLVMRLPFRGEFLINWDSVQFALGVEAFDLTAHQPHPPGYIGYIFLGQILAPVVGGIPEALTWISIVTGAMAPVVLFLLARRMLPERFAATAAILFGVSPLLWHYGSVALTYAPEVMLGLLFALFVHRAREENRVRDLMAATAVFTVLGSVRQSALILLLPLWMLGLLGYGWRVRAAAVAFMTAASLAWTIPLVRASGGVLSYLGEASALADLAVARTTILTGAFTGVLQNIGLLAVGLIVGMHVTVFLPWIARSRPGGALGALRASDRRFLLTWVALPLVFFILVHTGQPGYALMILPIGYIWVGSAIAQVVTHPSPRRSRPGAGAAPNPPGLTPVAAILAACAVLSFFGLSSLAYRAASSDLGARIQTRAGIHSPADRTTSHLEWAPTQSPLAQALRQYSIPHHDLYWARLMEFIQTHQPEDSVLLTAIGGPIISGSFRQLGYYLPEYRVYAVGWDRAGAFGYLFESHGRKSTYTVAGLNTSSATLNLPPETRWLVIPDADVAALLEPALPRVRHQLSNGTVVTVADLGNGPRRLRFASEGARASIGAD
ncbi:MAG: hypothetical protein EA350_08715 [Gemmatimonadales bacterium]|nr:MAG: hypothetical protein EA350_08715 [Gemmatimonadales bacterium]